MEKLQKILDFVYYRHHNPEFDQPCLYAIVGERKTLMIDGGVSTALARDFVDALKAETGRGVDFVVLTHWHWDHVFGLHAIDAPLLAGRNTAAHLKRMAGYSSWSDEALQKRLNTGEEIEFCARYIKKTYPGALRDSISIRQPDIVFNDSVTIELGGLCCDLLPLPAVHTNDSIAVSVPAEGLLFIGDSTGQNSYDAPIHYSAPKVRELFKWIRSHSPRLIMESHAEPASPEEFWEVNGVLEYAANAVLAGCHDKPGLTERLRQSCGGNLPEDGEEIIEFFLNGLGR